MCLDDLQLCKFVNVTDSFSKANFPYDRSRSLKIANDRPITGSGKHWIRVLLLEA